MLPSVAVACSPAAVRDESPIIATLPAVAVAAMPVTFMTTVVIGPAVPSAPSPYNARYSYYSASVYLYRSNFTCGCIAESTYRSIGVNCNITQSGQWLVRQ
jgi:hypothetical protein